MALYERPGTAADASTDAADFDSGDTLFTTTVPALSATDAARCLSEKVVAPAHVSSAGGMAQQLTGTTWYVPMHSVMEAFLYTAGPPDIVRYNFEFVVRNQKYPSLMSRQAYVQG